MTLIVRQGAIHGDSTLRGGTAHNRLNAQTKRMCGAGMYMMCMTSDHDLMSTADTVFLRQEADERQTVMVQMEGEDTDIKVNLSERLRPLMPDISIDGKYVAKVSHWGMLQRSDMCRVLNCRMTCSSDLTVKSPGRARNHSKFMPHHPGRYIVRGSNIRVNVVAAVLWSISCSFGGVGPFFVVQSAIA